MHRLKHMNPRAPQKAVHFGEVALSEVFDLRGFNLNAKLDIDPDFLKEDNHGDHEGHDHDQVKPATTHRTRMAQDTITTITMTM
jgi:G3E family GTPase